MKVINMKTKSGKPTEQYIINDTVNNKVYFQSYDTIIAVVAPNGKVFLDKDYWDYSNTTGQYRNRFLKESKKETERKIENGTYILAGLN